MSKPRDVYIPDDHDAEMLDREARMARAEGRHFDPTDDEPLEEEDGDDRPF